MNIFNLIFIELPLIENSVHSLFEKCDSLEDAISFWAALSTSLDNAAEENIKRLGGDIDAARLFLDRFFLLRPRMNLYDTPLTFFNAGQQTAE